MHYLIAAILVCYACGVLSLVWNLISSLKLITRQRALPPVPRDAREWPSLDVVVPVKDEADNIGVVLHSILAQDYPNIRILVVNDRSTDGTAAAVQALQDKHPNIERFDIKELPEGLYGKPHAVHCLRKELRGDYIAFVDSDLDLDPACLPTLVDHLDRNKFDWVAVMGKPNVTRFWERISVPLFGAVIFAWYDPRKISDPKWPNAIGSGLMACRRTAYEAIDGHRAVINIYDEDSELVRIAKRAGQKLSFVLTPELFAQRHYGTLDRTLRGMTRTFVGGIKTLPRLLFTANALHFVSHMPFIIMILLALLPLSGTPIPFAAWWWAAAITHLIASTGLAFLVFHTAGRDRHLALLHPLGSALLIFVCYRAIRHLRRGEAIAWRGTQYSS